jgi:hypothetical protein
MIAVIDGYQIVWPEGMPLPGKGDVVHVGENVDRIVDGMTFYPNEDPPIVNIETILPIGDWPSAVRYREKQERGPWWKKGAKVDA